MDAMSQIIITSSTASQMLMRDGKYPHKVMGTAIFEVGQILGARGNVGSKELQKGGAIYVTVERSIGDAGKLLFQLRGVNLQAPPGLMRRRGNPFFELYRKVERPTGATWVSVFRSGTVKNDLSPMWGAASLDIEATCNGDLDRAIKLIVWDHRRSGKHKIMGELETTIRGFVEAKVKDDEPAYGMNLIKHDNQVGVIQVLDATMSGSPQKASNRSIDTGSPRGSYRASNGRMNPTQQRPAFVDYLSGGCKISLAVAIDFTASNGDPRQPGTPHYFHPPESKEWNDYEKAIFAVGSILAKYDSDQQFPVWGFGAKYNNVVRHCFQCGSEVEVEGVQGIMDAYRGVFRTPLTMSYPTQFTEVVQTAAAYSRHEQEVAQDEAKLSYTILLILTAGNVENVRETKDQLIEASDDPLSVVIVGIGDADFTGMEFLDEHDDTEGGRDITKFVRFSEYKSFNALTEAVLDEIPDQLVDYYYSRRQLPGALENLDRDQVEVAPPDDDERTFTFLG